MVRGATLVLSISMLFGLAPATPAAGLEDVITLTAPYTSATVTEATDCARTDLCPTDAAATASNGEATVSALMRSAGAGAQAASQCDSSPLGNSSDASSTIVATTFLQRQYKSLDASLSFVLDQSFSAIQVPWGFPVESRTLTVTLTHTSCSDCGRAAFTVLQNASQPTQITLPVHLERLGNKLVPPGQITIKATTRAAAGLSPRDVGAACAMVGEVATQAETTLSNITLTLNDPS